MVMQTAKPVYNREYTERLVKILYSTYTESYIEQVSSNETQMNYGEITQLLRLFKDFEDLFDGTI